MSDEEIISLYSEAVEELLAEIASCIGKEATSRLPVMDTIRRINIERKKRDAGDS